MRIAAHPTGNRTIAVDDYLKEFGHPSIDARADTRPEAICPFCRTDLYVVAEGTKRSAHFKHRMNVFCPSKDPAGRPYLPLKPTTPDPVAGARLRQAFRAKWRWHFFKISKMIPFLAPEEFTGLIERATENDVWEHVDFPESDIPYVFVILADFPPWTSTRSERKPQRALWFRFWFSPDVRTIDDLWIWPETNISLHRASFEPPARSTSVPKYEDLLKETLVEIDHRFLDQPDPRIPGFIETAVESWFDCHPDFAG